MSKQFILTMCVGFALLLARQSRTRQDLPPAPILDASPSQRRLASARREKPQRFERQAQSRPASHRDPRTVVVKEPSSPIRQGAPIPTDFALLPPDFAPLYVCERAAPILPEVDLRITQKYAACPLLDEPPENTTLLLIEGVQTFGRTGNNLIEFLHSLQYGQDYNVVVGIMPGSWPTHLITNMWLAIQNNDRLAWGGLLERALCVKLLHSDAASELQKYRRVIRMGTKELFKFKHRGSLNEYVEFQGHILRTLYRFYNTGTGANMRRKPVGDMCSVLEALFGDRKGPAVYSVIHSRSLEGEPGLRLLGRIARNVGSDPVAALDMEPAYVKAILGPLGMLDRPILFLTDHQRPEVLEKLQADPDIGPNILLVPEEASWVGGDITAAVMSTVFIGNPASTFSGFIAKTRVALGYHANYLFRKQKKNGAWVDVCNERGIFDNKIMNVMA